MRTQFDQHELDRWRSDPDNYVWGVFYFNARDPRVILPKRNQWMGWTLNFAHPYSYLVILGFVVLAMVMGQLQGH